MNDEDEVINDLLEEADALEQRGLRIEAMQRLHNASSLRKDAVVLTRIGVLATDLQDWKQAQTALEGAVALEPDFVLAHFYLGLMFQAQCRFGDALKSLQTAVRLEPSATNYTVMGVAQTKLDLLDEAQQSFERAISIDPTYEEAYYNLATTLEDDDRERAMLLLKRHSTSIQIMLWPTANWADSFSTRIASAETAFRRAIEIWPDQGVAYWCLAYFLQRQGQQQEAEDLYQRALEVDPGDAEANRLFGSFLKDIGR